MFHTVIAIFDKEAKFFGIYTDRQSAVDARKTMAERGIPGFTEPDQLVILEWLLLYGYNSVFLPGNDCPLPSDQFFSWTHSKEMPYEVAASIIDAANQACRQFLAMFKAGSFRI